MELKMQKTITKESGRGFFYPHHIYGCLESVGFILPKTFTQNLGFKNVQTFRIWESTA